MNNLNLNTIAASLAFPFEADNSIFVRESCSCNASAFVKVRVRDILYLERQHDCPSTSIHLIGDGTVKTDASIDEIISAVHVWPSVRRRDSIPTAGTAIEPS